MIKILYFGLLALLSCRAKSKEHKLTRKGIFTGGHNRKIAARIRALSNRPFIGGYQGLENVGSLDNKDKAAEVMQTCHLKSHIAHIVVNTVYAYKVTTMLHLGEVRQTADNKLTIFTQDHCNHRLKIISPLINQSQFKDRINYMIQKYCAKDFNEKNVNGQLILTALSLIAEAGFDADMAGKLQNPKLTRAQELCLGLLAYTPPQHYQGAVCFIAWVNPQKNFDLYKASLQRLGIQDPYLLKPPASKKKIAKLNTPKIKEAKQILQRQVHTAEAQPITESEPIKESMNNTRPDENP